VHTILYENLKNAFSIPSLTEGIITTIIPSTDFYGAPNPTPFSGFCTIAKVYEVQKISSSIYITLSKGGEGFSAIKSHNNISFASDISFYILTEDDNLLYLLTQYKILEAKKIICVFISSTNKYV
jgi:hypothetical protein